MIKTIDEFNLKLHKDSAEFIAESDNDYFTQIQKVVKVIEENIEKTPIILLSGPSGSGKTTTALNIEAILDNKGLETHTLSLDNYFRTIDDRDMRLLEEGKLDLESPDRVDNDFLNSQLKKMINCESVELPKYDFKAAKRVKSGVTLNRKHNEPVILEGIHSLNPKVIEIPEEQTLKIYVSVRTRVKYGGITMHPSYIRLLRRMARDSLFRGRPIEETIKMFGSVEVGAEKYIMPYKSKADIDIDTFIPYELSVYKTLLFDKLKACEEKITDERICEVIRVLSALDGLSEEKVPKNSLIREFIGNGSFEY